MLVREVLAGMGEAVGLDPTNLNDIRTAVTEACDNVVLHAYDGAEGPMEIEVLLSSGEVEVVVRDRGTGIRPHIGREGDASGIGLLVIQALVYSVAFKGAGGAPSAEGGEGTEVRMVFATPGLLEAPRSDRPKAIEPSPIQRSELANTTVITLAPIGLARAVLPRLLSALAARANFSTDRIADAQLIADALAMHAPQSSRGDQLSLTIRVKPRDLELRIAPLRSGRARILIAGSAINGLGPVIETLTDDHRVASVGSCEMLALRMVDGRPPLAT